MDGKLDSMGNELKGLTQGQQMVTEKLEWIARYSLCISHAH